MSTETEVSHYEVEVREIVGRLQQSERDVIADWLNRQTRLETENWKGYSNCSVLVSWLLRHGFAITMQNLSTALTNCQANGQRKIFWKDGPKEDRSFVGGRKNYAHPSNKERAQPTPTQAEFYPNGKRNHNYRPPDAAPESAEATDPWQSLIDKYLCEWTTHSQRARLQGELNAGLAAGRSRREIAEVLGKIVRDCKRGR